MSSAYLTSKHLAFLQRLLGEEPVTGGRETDSATTAARLLINRFQTGMQSETALRGVLAAHDARHRLTMNNALARWDNEGGAIGTPQPSADTLHD